jgi:hypothetical protein
MPLEKLPRLVDAKKRPSPARAKIESRTNQPLMADTVCS